jgi:hypothetical protein
MRAAKSMIAAVRQPRDETIRETAGPFGRSFQIPKYSLVAPGIFGAGRKARRTLRTAPGHFQAGQERASRPVSTHGPCRFDAIFPAKNRPRSSGTIIWCEPAAPCGSDS